MRRVGVLRLLTGLALIAGLAGVGCTEGKTSLLLELDGPAAITSVDVKITVGTAGSLQKTLPLGQDGLTLPGKIVVELPDVATLVNIDLVGHLPSATRTAHATVTAQPHVQLRVMLSLADPTDGDLGGSVDLGAGGDLPAVAGDLAGTSADLVGTSADLVSPSPDLGSADLNPGKPVPVARLIGNAYYSDHSGSTFEFPAGMSKTSFEISTTGIVDGDLVVFIANIDNGSGTIWPNPIAPGFTQLAQAFYGGDGQSYVVAWKLAKSEPATYSGVYGSGVGSGSATITLIAVSGANQTEPINAFLSEYDPGTAVTPVPAVSTGVTTTVPNCLLLYAAGSDWMGSPGTNTFTLPTGFTSLTTIADRGGAMWDWTSQMIGSAPKPATGATGAISGSMEGTFTGTAWTAVIAIAP